MSNLETNEQNSSDAECPNCKHDSLLRLIPGYDINDFCWRCGWPVHNNGPNAPKGKRLTVR